MSSPVRSHAHAFLAAAALLHAERVEPDVFAQRVVRTVAEILPVARAGWWRYHRGDTVNISLEAVFYASDPPSPEPGARRHAFQFPVYFAALERGLPIPAADARTDPRTSEFAASYLVPNGIVSMLDTPVMRAGQVIGVLCLEHVGERRHWRELEVQFATTLAEMLAKADAERETAALIASLEGMVRERTAHLEATTATLRKTATDLERALRHKDEFVANMSHELRTPLTAILGHAEVLCEGVYGPLSPRQRAGVETIQASGRHLLSLVQDILDIARIEAGRLELSPDATPVGELLDESLRIVAESAQRKNLLLQRHDGTAGLTVTCDRRRVRQVLINLLANAVKFTPDGGRVGVDVHVRAAEAEVDFVVWDTGIGIAKDDMDRLFQRFVQVDASLSRRFEGAGLGLALVWRIAELHGGRVSVDSVVGQGSRFTFTLPLRVGARAEAAPSPAEAGSRVPPGGPAPRVLVVDDQASHLVNLGDWLEARGCRVALASSGADALCIAREWSPDLVLMDVQMPEMDGLDCTRRFRADPALAHVRIVAVTALATPGDRERCLEAGADACLDRPTPLPELLRTIVRLHSTPREAPEGVAP